MSTNEPSNEVKAVAADSKTGQRMMSATVEASEEFDTAKDVLDLTDNNDEDFLIPSFKTLRSDPRTPLKIMLPGIKYAIFHIVPMSPAVVAYLKERHKAAFEDAMNMTSKRYVDLSEGDKRKRIAVFADILIHWEGWFTAAEEEIEYSLDTLALLAERVPGFLDKIIAASYAGVQLQAKLEKQNLGK